LASDGNGQFVSARAKVTQAQAGRKRSATLSDAAAVPHARDIALVNGQKAARRVDRDHVGGDATCLESPEQCRLAGRSRARFEIALREFDKRHVPAWARKSRHELRALPTLRRVNGIQLVEQRSRFCTRVESGENKDAEIASWIRDLTRQHVAMKVHDAASSPVFPD
jgi:hypothetical protein